MQHSRSVRPPNPIRPKSPFRSQRPLIILSSLPEVLVVLAWMEIYEYSAGRGSQSKGRGRPPRSTASRYAPASKMPCSRFGPQVATADGFHPPSSRTEDETLKNFSPWSHLAFSVSRSRSSLDCNATYTDPSVFLTSLQSVQAVGVCPIRKPHLFLVGSRQKSIRLRFFALFLLPCHVMPRLSQVSPFSVSRQPTTTSPSR
ncbi:hypothetical protein CKAH01_02464 [Colletotrichum kahawae]|uniref:Uncharacterized protein n=1 Tax=Colletotrichum kahawae TaxID=34407 RepID=A0AAE0CYU7_COLKA|nr:hypothetical protein CKAH01_02464 [Colletotrichum kahawae]